MGIRGHRREGTALRYADPSVPGVWLGCIQGEEEVESELQEKQRPSITSACLLGEVGPTWRVSESRSSSQGQDQLGSGTITSCPPEMLCQKNW